MFDRVLSGLNVEYASKRSSGRLAPPEAVKFAPGHYARLRDARVAAGASAGQIKDPVIALNEAEWSRVSEVRR